MMHAPLSPPQHAKEVGLLGPIPSETAPLDTGLSAVFRNRWSAFSARAREIETDDHRIWHFLAAPGIFERTPCAGVWCLSHNRQSEPGALVLAATNAQPPADGAWFTAARDLIQAATESFASADRLYRRLRDLPRLIPTETKGAGVTFWINDWEVHELHYDSIHALAATGLSDMTGLRPEIEGG
ncbi:MAG: hypothetical protein R8G34_15470 [Paracoccaceae bacterium]|nr:hypothetical protein [Paracoccaceae bacterium]